MNSGWLRPCVVGFLVKLRHVKEEVSSGEDETGHSDLQSRSE